MLDLPIDSLGPKPTKKQMELLKLITVPGATAHTWEGTSLGSGGAYIKRNVPGEKIDKAIVFKVAIDKISKNDVLKFLDWGWLEIQKRGFPGSDYIATDRARKVVEKGETR